MDVNVSVAAHLSLIRWGVVRHIAQETESDAQPWADADLHDVSSLCDNLAVYLLRHATEANAGSTQYVHRAQHRHHMRLRPRESKSVTAALTLLGTSAQRLLPFGLSNGLVVE